MFSLQQRAFAFVGFLFFLLMSIGLSFIGLSQFKMYLTYPDPLTFSIWTVFAICFVFFFSPLLMMLIPVVFFGKQVSVYYAKKLFTIMMVFLSITVFLMITFSSWYKNSLSEKGYSECINSSSGWMPGTGTKYAKYEVFCYKKAG
ncbi:hypothetical protein ACFQW4_08085 [Pantoea sp. GCM10028869]|uniref:hypothetical protein n=1 Tax=Pantoea sp. GCM10028869 TaxID=3273417 RepID=UPI00360660A6